MLCSESNWISCVKEQPTPRAETIASMKIRFNFWYVLASNFIHIVVGVHAFCYCIHVGAYSGNTHIGLLSPDGPGQEYRVPASPFHPSKKPIFCHFCLEA